MNDTVTIPKTLAWKLIKALAHAGYWNKCREESPEVKAFFQAHPEKAHTTWIDKAFDDLSEAMGPE